MTDLADKSTRRRAIRVARRALRAELGDAGWHARAHRVAEAALTIRQVVDACARGDTVASYSATDTEPPTAELNRRLAAAGARVVLPIHDRRDVPPATLGWHWAADPDFELIGLGAEALLQHRTTVVLLPALAVTVHGCRLGQGGGYYDRLLAELPRYPAGPLRLAVVGPGEVVASLPADSHDQDVDGHVLG